MPKLRKEIILLTHPVSSGVASEYIGVCDTNAYSAATYRFEVFITATTTNSIGLRRLGTTTDDATIATAGTGWHSVSFTPPAGLTEYVIHVTGSGTTVASARIRIVQNQASLVATESQVEIGTFQTTAATSNTTPTQPKYFRFTAANWDGLLTCYFDVCFKNGSTSTSTAVVLQVENGSGGWTDVVTATLANTLTATRVRTATFTPVDGRLYRTVHRNSSTMVAATLINAKIVIQQTYNPDTSAYVSKTESHFLAGFYAGSALSDLGAYYDPTDWSDVTTSFIHAVDATATTSASRQLTLAGSTLTGSLVTDPAMHTISGIVSVPATAGLLAPTGTLTSGTIFAQRLIAVAILAAAPPPAGRTGRYWYIIS
jgi:hypothetical protein